MFNTLYFIILIKNSRKTFEFFLEKNYEMNNTSTFFIAQHRLKYMLTNLSKSENIIIPHLNPLSWMIYKISTDIWIWSKALNIIWLLSIAISECAIMLETIERRISMASVIFPFPTFLTMHSRKNNVFYTINYAQNSG